MTAKNDNPDVRTDAMVSDHHVGEDHANVADAAGDAAMQCGDFAQAERLYSTALANGANSVLVNMKRGQALFQLGRTAEAYNDFKRTLEVVPDVIEVQRVMGQLCRSLHLYEESASAFESVVKDEPSNPEAWLGFAEALTLSYSRFDEGPGAFERAAALGAHDPEFMLSLADRNLVNGRFEQAEQLLRHVFELSPEVRSRPLANLWLARALRAQGKNDDAEAAYQTALAQYQHLASNSQDASAIINAGMFAYVLHEMGNVAQAEQVIEDICTGWPQPEDFRYDHTAYLPDSLDRIEHLRKLVAGRDLVLLLYGPSAHGLADKMDVFRDIDVCFASVNKFDEVENNLLRPVGRQLDIVVTSNPSDIRQRWDAYHDFLARESVNMLIATNYVLTSLRPPYSVDRRFIELFDKKLLFFESDSQVPPTPITPLHLLAANTLSIALPLLALAKPRRIFIFGADGGGTDGGEQAYFFGETAEVDNTARRQQEAVRRLTNEAFFCDHVAPFSILAMTKLFGSPAPEIYNCCPHSNYRAFTRVSSDEGLALLKAG